MITLSESVAVFLGEHKKSTRKSYQYVLWDFESYTGPARPVADISALDIIRYAQHLDARATIKSPATYNKYVKTLRTFCNWCVRMKFLEETPALAIKQKKTSRRIPKDKSFPDAALARLLDFTKWDARADALVRFLADTGCRIGGAAGLRVSDVDIEQRRAIVTEKGKTDPRPVFFGDACARALTVWLLKRDHSRGDYVFSSDGHRMGNDHLAQYFRRLCERAGIGSYGPHSLRHRKGHQMADSRVAPSIAAKALGHEDVSITLNYYYPQDWERVAETIRKLSEETSEDTNILQIQPRRSGTDS